MDREMKPVKRFLGKVVSILLWVLLYLGIFGLSYSLFHGLSESVKYEAKSEALAAENEYLKSEIEWFKAQLSDMHSVSDGTEASGVQPTSGD